MTRPLPFLLWGISLLLGVGPLPAVALEPASACTEAGLPDGATACEKPGDNTWHPLPLPQLQFVGQQPDLPTADQANLDNQPHEPAPLPPADLEVDPALIEASPVLRDWLQQIPDIADEIQHDPSFRTRLRLSYSQYPSTRQTGGVGVSLEDLFLWPGGGLTLSGNYNRNWEGNRENYGAEARYYVFPLGGYVNLAPVVGYQSLETPNYATDGVNLGFRFMLVPSRGGGADLAVSQSWVAPGSPDEVGLTGVTLGYAITNRLRLSTDLQFQNSRFGQDSRLGLGLEWLL